MTDMSAMDGETDPNDLAHPQPLYKLLRDAGAAVDMGPGDPDSPGGFANGTVIVGGTEEVRHVLSHPEIFSSGIDAVSIGQVRPLIPLQIDPPEHKNYRKLLDPIFAPRNVAKLEDQTRALVVEMVEPLVAKGGCNFHHEIAEPLPTTVFLQLLGLPVSRAREFIDLKDGIIRPPVPASERVEYTNEVGKKIYAVNRQQVGSGNPVGVYDVAAGTFQYLGEVAGLPANGTVLVGFSPDGRLYAANMDSNEIYRLDVGTLSIAQSWQVNDATSGAPVDLNGADIAFGADQALP